jgi:hypothetical protein
MKQTLSIFMCILLSTAAFSGGEKSAIGARSMALGGTSLVNGDIWAAFNNQAGMMGMTGMQAGIYYQSLFYVDGLGEQGFVFSSDLGKGRIGVDVSSFGMSAYKDNRIGLAYAMRLGERFDMGVQLNYNTTRIQGDRYGKRSSLTAELGVITHITDNFDLGVHLYNPSQALLSEYEDERIPTVLGIGGAYSFSDKVKLLADVAKDIDRKAQIGSGLEYHIAEAVWLRAGVSTAPTYSSFGAGFKVAGVNIDIAAAYHNTLGYSTQLSLFYQFNARN